MMHSNSENEQAMRASRLGVIDIGSNSVRLVVYEIFGASFTPIYNEKVLAGLGRDLHLTGKLHEAGSALAFAALKRFKILAEAQNLTDVLVGATAALRDASDAAAFINKVRDEIGLDISPLSGEQEAYMSAMGVLAGDHRAQGLAADLGGASLELIRVGGDKVSGGTTYPLGPFSMFKGAFDPKELRPRIETILSQKQLPALAKGQNLYLIGGAWRNLSIIHQKRTGYPLRVAHNYDLSFEAGRELAQWAISVAGSYELLNWPNVSARRADTLPYSGLLLDVLLERLEPKHIIIAPGGLRDGLVYDALPAAAKKRSALFDACQALARGNQQGINFGQPLYDFLGGIWAALPHSFDEDTESRLRKAACLLVGIGKGLHPDHKARMVFRTVLYAPLPGLTHKERAYLALMLFSSYTSKKTIPNDPALMHLLSEGQQNAARIYGEAMRLGVAIAGRSRTALSQLSIKTVGGKLMVTAKPKFEDLISAAAQLQEMLRTDTYERRP